MEVAEEQAADKHFIGKNGKDKGRAIVERILVSTKFCH